MARTPSNMLPLGTTAPNFQLPDTVSGETLSLDELKSDKGTVVIFICNHCPFVIHILSPLVQVLKDYQEKGMAVVLISSNDVANYPDDSPEKMKELAQEYGFSFPYLYDESQEVAKAYDAACTPDFYVFDGDLKCHYRGQFDAARPGNDAPITGEDLKKALDNLLEGNTPLENQVPSLGCNIKWKS